jgi:hypothetical protein
MFCSLFTTNLDIYSIKNRATIIDIATQRADYLLLETQRNEENSLDTMILSFSFFNSFFWNA